MGWLLQVERPIQPGGYWEVVGRHLPLALLSGALLLAAAWIPFARIPFRICVFYRLTGYPCFSCGWTRGFSALAHGQWQAVWHDCPLVILLYLLTALVLAWNAAGLLLGVKLALGPGLRLTKTRGLWLGGVLSLLILLNWIYRLALGLN